MSQVSKEQIWNAVVQNNEAILKVLKGEAESQFGEFKSARERVVSGVLQINSLFLTGWIALLSVGKLGHTCSSIFYFLLIGGCGLHIAVFGFVLWSQWKVMRLGFNSQNRASNFETLVRQTLIKKQELIANSPTDIYSTTLLQEIAKLDEPLGEFGMSYSSSHKKENRSAWFWGVFAAITFFVSMVFSLISFVVLITP